MNILFYDTKPYDKKSLDMELEKHTDVTITYHEADISEKTVSLAKGYDAICAFVNSDLSGPVIEKLADIGIKLILLRCAGFNNVDIDKANEKGITILRVPGY